MWHIILVIIIAFITISILFSFVFMIHRIEQRTEITRLTDFDTNGTTVIQDLIHYKNKAQKFINDQIDKKNKG